MGILNVIEMHFHQFENESFPFLAFPSKTTSIAYAINSNTSTNNATYKTILYDPIIIHKMNIKVNLINKLINMYNSSRL